MIRLFAAESAVYRVSMDIDMMMDALKEECGDHGRASIEAISHYAVEAAILKVFGSEMLDYIADEAVQIHGGMGYSAEMDVERGYRDSRINRIFEGTNEINRLLVVDTAMKRALKGEFDLFGKAEALYNNLDAVSDGETEGENYFEEKSRYIRNFKNVIMICIQGASKSFEKNLISEQEVLNNIADMMMECYASESLNLRIGKLEKIRGTIGVYRDILDINVYDTAGIIRKSPTDAVNSFAPAGKAPALLTAVEALTKVKGINVKNARRRIADKLTGDNRYSF